MAAIGSVISGRYELVEIVGQGGMSTVYRARDQKLNIYYAIKEIKKESGNELIAETSMTEVNLLKGLNNSHIPRIIDIIDDGVNIFVVQEFIQGISLEQKLEEEKQFPQETVVEWMKQMCNVLYYLHNQNVIHRDIKPGNIMWAPSSENEGHITLIDFGAGRVYKKGKTRDTVAFLTEAFAAPEQKNQISASDARTDIYSLGLTMYTLLTGLYPDETYKVKPITEIDANLSTGLEKIILKCIKEEPGERYQTALELLYDLEHYRENEDLYIAQQRKKLNLFIIFASLCLVCAFISGIFSLSISGAKSKNYSLIVKTATTPEECIDAIAIKPGEPEGYYALWTMYNESDYCISSTEMAVINKLIVENQSDFQSKNDFAKLNYQIGQDVWFNYGGTDNEIEEGKIVNDATKSSKAVDPFFNNVISNASDDSGFLDDANAYIAWNNYIQSTAKSQKSGQQTTDEVLIEGWKSLHKLITSIDKGVEPIVRLKMCSQVVSSIETNVYRYKNAGISAGEIMEALATVNTVVNDINNNDILDNKLVTQLKQNIVGVDGNIGSLKRAEKALYDAYPEVGNNE